MERPAGFSYGRRMKDLLLDLTERYTYPICIAVITVVGLVSPWVPSETRYAILAFVEESVRAFLGF